MLSNEEKDEQDRLAHIEALKAEITKLETQPIREIV
jgi:hypothetical protein